MNLTTLKKNYVTFTNEIGHTFAFQITKKVLYAWGIKRRTN